MDKNGREIKHSLNRQVISLSIAHYRKIPRRIIASGATIKGKFKGLHPK
ncbi:hypothetical protein EPK99_01925 [Neorhizobium lilium]|uniref:Uncharacterized protein n=1 Tax=Neorhizobium lilium TaxID=2503024 RepID=A0A3S4UUE7_9HYPH|nr:hypothetical protein EPK99_01925 [Neorhizobium lilium]